MTLKSKDIVVETNAYYCLECGKIQGKFPIPEEKVVGELDKENDDPDM